MAAPSLAAVVLLVSPADRVVAIAGAEADAGITEWPPGSNRNKYAEDLGRWNGQPWCFIFVSWVFWKAGLDLPDVEGNGDGLCTYCPAGVAYARRHGQTVALDQARPGDLTFNDWERDGVADHVGIIEKVTGAGLFHTIEGNTSFTGSQSNGGAVLRRLRFPHEVCEIWRPPSLTAPRTVPTIPDRPVLPAPLPALEEDPMRTLSFFPSWSQPHTAGPWVGRRPEVEVDLNAGQVLGYNGVAFDPVRDLAVDFLGIRVVNLTDVRLAGATPLRSVKRLDGPDGRPSDTFVVTGQGGAQWAFTAVPG